MVRSCDVVLCRIDLIAYRLDDKEGIMARRDDEPWVQLATRIPKALHRELKLHCVTNDIVLMNFVVAAVEERLGRASARKRRRAAS